MACDMPGATILAPLPGFVMYEMSARLQGLKFVGVPLTRDFELDEAAMLAAIEQHRPAIIYIAYPEQPDRQPVRRRRGRAHRRRGRRAGRAGGDRRGLPAVRAAATWMRHGRATAARAADAHAEQVRPGRRAHRLHDGPAALIAEIDKVRPPYNISVLNGEAALFALEHADVFARQAATLRGERARLQAALAAMPGVNAWPATPT